MSEYIKSIDYKTRLPSGAHWSLRARKGTIMRLTDPGGSANVGMMFYNPENLLERYNAPDTLKCQHTFKLTRGNCLYSDMGRIFASVVDDEFGWHDTVCGNIRAEHVEERWGERNYQQDRNGWKQNGHDSFLVELAKYGLGPADLGANVNWFSKVVVDDDGNLTLDTDESSANDSVILRFEMDTLVVMHTCPHPFDVSDDYPKFSVGVELGLAQPVQDEDYCKNFRPENERGFANNALYLLGFDVAGAAL